MLSCRMDVPIKLNVGLTLFTGILAVGFTFISLGKDILRKSYAQSRHKEDLHLRSASAAPKDEDADLPLLEHDMNSDLNLEVSAMSVDPAATAQQSRLGCSNLGNEAHSMPHPGINRAEDVEGPSSTVVPGASEDGEVSTPNVQQQWNIGASRADDLMAMATQGTKARKNVFIATFEGLLTGFCLETVLMGLLWSLSLTCMHFGGLFAMQIPEGYMTLSPVPVVMSALISWVVCIAGYIYMTNVEPFLSQQVLFSTVAAVGIATMHFTGTVEQTSISDAKY